jgi:1-deoxy-D-xylulose-5-phosphate reductoisomerase
MGSSVTRLAILGSTGSIGRQTIEVVRAFPGRFRVIALTAGNNLDLLSRQIDEFRPDFVHCLEPQRLKTDARYHTLSADEIAAHPDVDIAVIAASGRSGLTPTLAAVRVGKTIALANKESLVAAGEIIMAEAKAYSARIRPVDSEHSAIWQCLDNERRQAASVILTASGGPFLHRSLADMARVTAAEALNHPSWKMGKKVTIDSATLMNKGLEIIEAHWLFDMPYDRIKVLIHPQSIVHSMVEFADGTLKAQMSCPDMRFPIQYALSYPERWHNPTLPNLDWSHYPGLEFEPPDFESFPCLRLAIAAGKQGGTYPAVLSGADEAAVEMFLAGRIKFTDIASIVASALDAHVNTPHPDLDQILAADSWARQQVLQNSTRLEKSHKYP